MQLVLGAGRHHLQGARARRASRGSDLGLSPTARAPDRARAASFSQAVDDAPELLAADVHRAGAGLCDDAAVDFLARRGPGAVEELLLDAAGAIPAANVPFDRDADHNLSLCLEASHNRARSESKSARARDARRRPPPPPPARYPRRNAARA